MLVQKHGEMNELEYAKQIAMESLFAAKDTMNQMNEYKMMYVREINQAIAIGGKLTEDEEKELREASLDDFSRELLLEWAESYVDHCIKTLDKVRNTQK